MLRTLIRVALFVFLCTRTASPLVAQEIRIGHLETNDDAGINWLYVVCNKLSLTEMRCDFFQTLIMKKGTFDPNSVKQPTGDPLTIFDQNFGLMCKPLAENFPKMQQAFDSGIGADGKPVNKRIGMATFPMMRAIVETCKSHTPESAARFLAEMKDRDDHTCKVHTDHSQSLFAWDSKTNSWDTQEGPTGPCGSYLLGTLTQDPTNHFWHYVEKHLRMNPENTFLNGQSCSKLPDFTLNYTWQTTETKEGCDLIESLPD
jgi:hypothetical protein